MKLLKIAPLIIIVIVLGFAMFSYIRHPFMRTFKHVEKPVQGTALAKASCVICHTKPPTARNMNPYGKDLQDRGGTPEAFIAIRSLDSDKDGFTNEQETKAGTLPGDPKSKPTVKKQK